MTTGTIALLAWFRQSTNKGPSMTNTTTSGPSTTKRRNASPRKYMIHTQRTCFKCKQKGHYARDCPRATNQKPIETKMERIQTLLESMTTIERKEFKKYVLGDEDKSRVKTATTLLSKETNSRTNRTFTEAPPSRETGPHLRQMLKQLTKTSEQCERCDGTHPTHICMKQFLKTQKSELTPRFIHDDDSTRSDTLCDSE